MTDSFRRLAAAVKAAKAAWKGQVQEETEIPDWADGQLSTQAPSYHFTPPTIDDFDPEGYVKDLLTFKEGESKCIPWLMREVEEGRAVIDRGFVYHSRLDRFGMPTKECAPNRAYPYILRRFKGPEGFKEVQALSDKGDRLREDMFGMDTQIFGPFDPNQYTEYAPLLGGYFFAQQYLTDMLKGFAYAFEAWNHNPVAHRIVDAISQYTLGRRFTWLVKDEKKEKVWDKWAEDNQLRQRLSKYWLREKIIFGEILLDNKKWRTIHPGTVWDIVTDPDDFADVYYYYRSYPTAYQMFSGYKVPGVPGSKEVPSQRYVIEQVPYSQIIHVKSNCTSFEKRGRSRLYSILGWLKRIKDIYNCQAIREQMLCDYVWDVEIKGGPGDVAKYAAQYAQLAKPGSTHFHNEAIKRTPLYAATGAGRSSGTDASQNILAFIATAIGMPKDFFNVIAQAGGSRATALVASEPFTKAIEDEQADVEHLLHKIFNEVMAQAGMEGHDEDIEFTFPSVAKDTTTETVKNIILGEAQGYISKERAATMYTQEMAVTAYEFEKEQQKIKNEASAGLSNFGQPQAPEGRMGGAVKPGPDEAPVEDPNQPMSAPQAPQAPEEDDGTVHDGDNPLHGTPNKNLKDQMKRL